MFCEVFKLKTLPRVCFFGGGGGVGGGGCYFLKREMFLDIKLKIQFIKTKQKCAKLEIKIIIRLI